MSYVIYSKRDLHLWKGTSYGPKHYETERAAKGQLTKLTKGLRAILKEEDWGVMSYDEYVKLDVKTTVKSLMTGSDVEIDINSVGGCCDPSTERYHCM
jgi:hypothetical protein